MRHALLGFFLLLALPLHAENEAVTASNQFAFDCLSSLEKEPGNLAFSPYSIWTALAMTSAGAGGTTLEEMGKTLRIARPADNKIHDQAGRWMKELNSAKGIELKTANRLWADSSFTAEKTFSDLVNKDYGAAFAYVDFKSKPEAARLQINQWIESQTANRIKDLLHPEDVDQLTRLVLTNAIYFKAPWKEAFSPRSTNPAPFTTAAGKIVQRPMMSRTGVLPYFETKDYQAIRLSYEGGETSMVLVLPSGKNGSPGASAFRELCHGLKEEQVRVGLPRFLIENRMALAKLLDALGMKSAFTADANFDRLSRQKLRISSVLHQAFVKVGEKGTEAAAATAVVMELTMARPEPEKLREFIANRPFFFFIVHDSSGGILFAGRVDNPEAPEPEKEQ